MKPRIRWLRSRGVWTCSYKLIGIPVVYGDGRTPSDAYRAWRQNSGDINVNRSMWTNIKGLFS